MSSTPEPHQSAAAPAGRRPGVQELIMARVNNKLWGVSSAFSNKRKAANNDDDDDDEAEAKEKDHTYHDLGRIFGRISDPYADVTHVVAMGVKSDTADTEEDDYNNTHVFVHRENIDSLKTWRIWCERCPAFRKDILDVDGCEKSATVIKKINNKILSGINSARGDDTSSLKAAILKYIPQDSTIALSPVISLSTKADRGWKHPATAELLCPLEWAACEDTYTQIIEGRKKVTADYWPRLMYPTGRQYDAEDMTSGLLNNHVLLRAAKHIFQGPTSALEGPGFHRGKRSNARIIGLTSMTPETIAYVVVQTRHALSAQPSWQTIDVHFNYPDFFWDIVRLFDHGEGKDIIDIFNYHVFGPTASTPDEVEETPRMPDLERLRAERERKRARTDA